MKAKLLQSRRTRYYRGPNIFPKNLPIHIYRKNSTSPSMVSRTRLAMFGILAALASMLGLSAFAALAIAPAAAQGSEGSCWGEATADAVPLGEHSSGFDEPRTGLGNLKNIFEDWAGLLGFLETASGEELSDCA
jgi:hypothetical protein